MKKNLNKILILFFATLTIGFSQNNYSLSFDGVDDYVLVGHNENLNLITEEFSFLTTVKFLTDNPKGYILSKRYYSAGQGYEIRVANNTLYAEINPGGGAITLTAPIESDNSFHTFLVTFKNQNYFRLYMDGVLVDDFGVNAAIGTQTDFSASSVSNNENLVIGDFSAMDGRVFNGLIHKLSIANTSLSIDQVEVLFQDIDYNLSENLVADWNFNEGSGSTLNDISGNGNNGIISGASWSDDVPILPTPPVIGGNNSLSFDGIDDYIYFNSTDLNNTFSGYNPFSVSFWIYGNELDPGAIFGKGSTPNDGGNPRSVMLYNQGMLSFILYSGTSDFIAAHADLEILEADTWNNVILTYDGGTGSNSLRFYKNGYLFNNVEQQTYGSYTGVKEVSEPFYLGARVQDDGAVHQALLFRMDEVSVWNKALSEEETQSYSSTSFSGNESGLVSYWNFDEGDGTILSDLSSNGNNGTINGATWTGDGAPVEVLVSGCTDIYAENYDSEANSDDGSCSGYPNNGNYSLDFNGSGDHVNLGTSPDTEIIGDITISAWIRIDNFDNVLQGVVSKANDESQKGYGIEKTSTLNSLSFWTGDGNNWCEVVSPILSTDTWYFVSATNDGSTSKIYINGELTNTSNCGAPAGPTADLRIGVHSVLSNNERFWDGLIDDVSIWSAVLSDEEIENLSQSSPIGDEEGLVAYWSFNSGDGDILYDYSGNGSHGTINGPTWSEDVYIPPTPPVFGGNNSFSFDGDDDRVELPNQITEGLTSVTFMAWFNTTDHSGYSNIVQDDGPSGALYIRYNPDGSFKYVFKASQGWRSISISPPSYGVWHHVAMSWDGINIKAYLDGEEVGSSSGSGTMSGGGPIYIGNWQQQEGFSGKIDDVQYWNIALSESEIQAHMNTEPTGNEEGLIGYWNFNESEGSELIDLSGNGYNGTVYGATWSGDGAPVEAPVFGCTDIYAENYDSEANLDDGSCSGYPENGEYSLSFGASQDHVDLGSNMDSDEQFSIATWVYIDESLIPLNGQRTFINKVNSSNGNKSIFLGSYQSKIGFTVLTGEQSNIMYGSDNQNGSLGFTQTPLVPGWQHIGAVFTGDSMLVYINGELDANVVVFQNPGSVNDYDNSVWHMADVLGGSGNVGGKISSMSLWSKPLQQYDIQNLMSESPDPLSAGLMGMWKFVEGEGSLLHDHSGNGNHGTITGATWSDDVPYVGPEWFVSINGDDSNIGSQDEPFATIQHAINTAHNGHIVLVSPGTYTENINYNGRNILVISEMGPSETIIDGGQNGSVVTFNSGETDGAALDGFTVTNGLTENGNGGGIFIDNSSPNIFNVIVENNHANSGGGIDLKGETQTVISNSIVRNNSAEWGAGIYCHSNSPTIENVVVSGNHATVNAGGVYAREYASPIIINCTIVNNSTDGQGGGILTWFNSTVDVKNSIIRDNYPNELGHVSGGSVTLNYSNISGNHEGFSGSNNINVDPMFCNQSNNDFRIAQDSPCFGTGESGTDIGAMFDGDYCQESFVNNSLSFDGQDDWVDLNTMNDIVLNNMMYSFWINTDGSNNDNQCVINTRNGQIWIPINDVSVIHGADMINNNGGSPWQKVSSPSGTITPGNWHHIVFSVMGDSRELYVDNILVSSSSVEEGFNGNYPYSEIGSEGKDGRTNWFRGRIDEASIWSHGADVNMVEYLFNYKLKGDEEELIGYWDFDDGEGAALSDLSGNGNDGIINGATWDNYGAPIGPTGGENNEPDINGRLSGIISASFDNTLLESAHIVAISEDNNFSAEAYSDTNGTYSLDLVGSLNYFVNISYEGLVDHNEYLYVAPFEETTLNASLNVLEDAIVEGTVTDWYTNTPLASASVLLAYTDEEMETIESMTDESGYFMVQVPGEKDYDLFVYADGYWVEHDAFFLSSGSQQEINIGIAEMSSASRLYGTIKDIETNELIPYAEIQLNCDQASDWDHTGALGTYRLFNYYSGDCDDGVLIVSASGYETSVQSASDIAFEAGSSYEMDITLMQGDDPDPGMISGTVFSNIDQSTIGSATINAYNVNTTQLFSIETSEEGSYQLFLPESEYYISITANNHEEHFDTLSVVSGQSFTRDFYLDEIYLNTVSGIVAGSNGNGLFDIEIFVSPEGEGYTIASTFTNEVGEYTLQVPNGRYDFGAGNTNYYMTFKYSVELSGSDQNIDFTLTPVAQFDGGFAGLVHLNEGDNSTVWLNIWNSDLTYQAYVSSDENGGYTLPLINGTYSLYAWVPGSNYQSVYVPNAFTVEDNVINYDIYFVAPDAPEPPTIVFLNDVSNDQGGQLELAWTPGDPREYEIFPQYSIWRMDEEWNLISTVPYRGSDVYSVVVPTLGDSTQEGIVQSTFMVTAHTINENIFFDSNPVISYSIDNIFPGIPQQLVASFSGEVVDLDWVHSEAEDLSHYNLYRQNVIIGGSATIISSETNFYSDNVNQSGEFEYWVTAVDVSGNESDPSNAAMVTLGVEEEMIPMEFALLQNYPNPFNPSTQIMYTLPKTSAVEIVVYDMLGSKVRTLFSGSQDAGYKNVLWNATNEEGDPVSAGMYIYTIEANSFFASKKMILLK